jgi:hypothetical protein
VPLASSIEVCRADDKRAISPANGSPSQLWGPFRTEGREKVERWLVLVVSVFHRSTLSEFTVGIEPRSSASQTGALDR